MIKTYKQWMQTVHESMQTMNEANNTGGGGEVEALYSAYGEFLDSCIIGSEEAANDFQKEFQAMASSLIPKGGGSSFKPERSAEDINRQLEGLLERDQKPEVTTKAGAFRYLKLDKGVSNSVTLPETSKSFAMKNASGNYVPLSGNEGAGDVAQNKAGHYDIKGVLTNLNLYNLYWAMSRMDDHIKMGTNFDKPRKKIGMASYGSGIQNDLQVLKSVKNSLQIETLKTTNSIDGVTKTDLLKNRKGNPQFDDLKSITQVIPLYVTTNFLGNGGNEIDASKMVPKSITTVIKGEVTTKENSIPGGDDLFQQGSASPKGDVLAGLKSELGKMVEQYDGIKSIVVTGGASFEWQGGERNDAENRKLSESRAQSIAGVLKGLYPGIAKAVTTAGAEKAKIQPDEDKTKVEEYRKVYIQITGHNIGDDTEKVTSFEEISNSTWNKDKWTIKCYWMAVTLNNQNVVTQKEYEADLATYGKNASDGNGKYKVVG